MTKRQTKITILIYSLAGGGAERVVSYLLPYLKIKGIEVHLVLMNTTISYDIPKDIPIHYIETSQGDEHGLFKLIKLPWLAYKYARLLKKLKITHSFALLTRPSYINILSQYFTKKTYKISISERSYPSMQYGYNNVQSKINNFLIKRLYPKADQIICNSHGNANDLVKNYGINASKIEVVHNPINIENINDVEPDGAIFKKNNFNIITVGRMDAGKNHELLITAIVDVPQVHLFILGDGVLKEHLKILVATKGLKERVHFLGFDNNPFRFLKKADLFIFGSNHEGFPNVLLEAMACGLPLLTTNCKSGPDEIMKLPQKEVTTTDIMITDYGILTPVGNSDLLQKGLSYCIAHPEYLKNCRTKVKERIQDFKREPILEAYTKEILS
ncbi:glycosyltransferase [Maribacter ulvicola]|uniref:N-acetylgalactosamine-N,N'-diacetylbacillosaminyl-diphospho-undecaprenol 4-alpha-N-acetylgalactosaminyltransferase n=1 Tax=Maribacter ulvicola TaxID=228959 RepID=A0A1N6VJE1_9FLAO|nr:glycosyltransferase [Maribacter ulvicola]SIQ77856.1 N-acetylgalactosamine-N,N'-diacetylbacillosaminyl-diphospho-undecaprenol 4-alpha-N-acetylgalactosaminyltransferase [Maribacter ulvicola]